MLRGFCCDALPICCESTLLAFPDAPQSACFIQKQCAICQIYSYQKRGQTDTGCQSEGKMCVFRKKIDLPSPGESSIFQDMKNTLNQSIASSISTPTISSQHACYLLFLRNRCEIAALKKQFGSTPLQVVEFLTSKSVAAIEEMHETIRASLAIHAIKARDFAMEKLKTVCTDLIRQTTITAGRTHQRNHARQPSITSASPPPSLAASPPRQSHCPRLLAAAKAQTHAEHLVPDSSVCSLKRPTRNRSRTHHCPTQHTTSSPRSESPRPPWPPRTSRACPRFTSMGTTAASENLERCSFREYHV